ncbi:MAG: hypothetical protein ACR2OG_03745 [Gemmatimonadaceae bacterium]
MSVNAQLTAQQIIAGCNSSRQMLIAPREFAGTIQKLAESHARPNFIAPHAVEAFHHALVEYLNEADPTFLIRALTKTTRGQIYRTNAGLRFKATDNSPAWWVHYVLFHECELPPASFSLILETIPTHVFEVWAQVPFSISAAGWHVAHILPVKDRNVDYQTWSRKDLVRRCVRNIHPCNYFFIPTTDWEGWGGNERVIFYFADLYRKLYGSVWKDFLALAGADSTALGVTSGSITYRIGPPLAGC